MTMHQTNFNRHFTMKVFSEIERIARDYQKMAPEFEASLEELVAPGTKLYLSKRLLTLLQNLRLIT